MEGRKQGQSNLAPWRAMLQAARGCAATVALLAGALHGQSAVAAHAFAMYGEPKYPAGFSHFDWVDPAAPKGGTLYLPNPDRRTNFDKFNPYTLKGVTAPRVGDLLIESLATGSVDETNTMYGLLAEDMALADDRLSMVFRLRPQARFSNGDPVTARDVKYSFDTLKSKAAAPQYQTVLADVKAAVVVDARTVRFDFAQPLRELPLIVGSLPVFSPKWGAGKPFDKLGFDKPIGSGPYLIESFDPGRRVTFKRNPDWWAKDLPVRRGMYNFDRIVLRMYADDLVRLEAFKAGEFDIAVEYAAKNWARNYIGPKFRDGRLIKRELARSDGPGMQAFLFNLRKPLFQDKRVREALGLAYDFEWMNRQLFYNQYRRIESYFGGPGMAAVKTPGRLPDADELALLEPLRAKLDPGVFGPAPLPSSTTPPHSLRENLRRAKALLAEAGWTYRDGALRNAKGEPFEFEFLNDQPNLIRAVDPFARNLEKLGIRLKFRQVDQSLTAKRMDNFEFDMTSQRLPASSAPGNELVELYGSQTADTPGSNNYLGLKNPGVDAVIRKVLASETERQLETSVRALDRVLLNGFYVIPNYYGATLRFAHTDRLAYKYSLPFYLDFGSVDAWAIQSWWVKPGMPKDKS
jgi:microcin C transport system substrate-binding protein